MGFIGNFVSTKLEDLSAAATRAIVEFDPATASEAQMKTIADAVSAINARLAQTNGEIESLRKQIASRETQVHQRMDAAEILDKGGNSDKAAKLLDEIEANLTPKLDSDKAQLKSTESLVADLSARRTELETKLRTARQRIDGARREMERAKIDEERTHEQEQQAKRDAGLLRSASQLDTASDAMEEAAKKARARAEAARLNAQSFHGVSTTATEADPDVAAALAQAAGATAAPAQSVAERLAAMRAKG